MKPTRLFEFLDYNMNQFGEIPLLSYKEGGQWKTYTNKEVKALVDQLSMGLLAMGLSPNDHSPDKADKIGLLSANRPEWIILDIACQQAGLILCPIYPTTNPRELEYIFKDASVKCVFTGSDDLFQKVKNTALECPTVKHIFSFDKIPDARHWSELLNQPSNEFQTALNEIRQNLLPDHLATIIYTSGTTGFPKGVMLSHNNIVSNVLNAVASFPFAESKGKKVLSFLPLNHIFERVVTLIYLYSGNHIYYAESLETIADNLKEVKPFGFATVPRLLEKMYDRILSKGMELTGVKKKLFDWSVGLGLEYDNLQSKGIVYNSKLALANKLVFSKWREALGGNIEFVITGGAACQERLLRIFNAAKIPVYEGYGPTENSPVITVSRQSAGGTMFGTVGPPIIGQEVKLAEDGEIMVKGPSVMMGYYNKPDITAETIKDGWLLTGDIGIWKEFNGVKFLKITDRKKELFKTSGGKYVAPQPIENKLKESPFVEQVMVVGAEKKFVGAFIVPHFPSLREWMRQEGIEYSNNEDAVRNPSVKSHYQGLVETFNKYFNQVEQIKKFELLPNEWTIETGELTPTLKIKRKVIIEKYQNSFKRIYGDD